MAANTVGKLRFNPRSTWVSGTSYAIDDVVSYKNAFYICTVANSSTSDPSINTSQWVETGGGTYFAGEWSSGTAYQVGDIVTYTRDLTYNSHYTYQEKDTYISIQAGTNQNPETQTAYWTKISQGRMRDAFAYLGGINEGYVGGYKSTWDTLSQSSTVGMGDSFGEFKTPGTHNVGHNSIAYITKRYTVAVRGENTNNHLLACANSNTLVNSPAEMAFSNLSWYDGSLTTSPSTQAPRVIQVEGNLYSSMLVLFDNGEVHYTGYNGYGERGDGTTSSYTHPNQCGYANYANGAQTTVLRGIKAIRIASSSGGNYSQACSNYALTTNGTTNTLYAWGYNGYGQLGQGNTVNLSVPTAITNPDAGQIIEIWATGGEYGQLFVLTSLGNMYACGYNGNGNLGVGSATNTNQFSLTLVKAWGTGTNKIKKFNTCGGSSATSFLVIRNDNTLWTWGYNGYGQLGHNHTNTVGAPIQVYTGGYTGTIGNPVTSSANAGTPSGSAITDCWNAWMCGGNGYNYMYATRGTSDSSNTCYSCGYNGYYNLSVDQTTNNRSVLTTCLYRNSVTLTNVVDVTSNQGHSSSYISHAVKRSDNEWYYGAYNNGVQPIGHADTYNNRQYLDPDNLSSNFLLKNNGLYPFMMSSSERKYLKVVINGYSSAKNATFINLKTGRIYITATDNVSQLTNIQEPSTAGTSNGLFTPQRLSFT